MVTIRQLEVAVIGDEDLVSGLRLAGVRRYRIVKEDSEEEVRQALTEFSDDPNVGIIVILEDYLRHVKDLATTLKGRKTTPVVVEVPSKYGTQYKDVSKYYQAYVRKFIGFDIEI